MSRIRPSVFTVVALLLLSHSSFAQVITDVSKEVSSDARQAVKVFLNDWLIKSDLQKTINSFDFEYLINDERSHYYGLERTVVEGKLRDILRTYTAVFLEERDYNKVQPERKAKAIYELFSVEDELEAGLSGIRLYVYAEVLVGAGPTTKFVLTMYKTNKKWKVFGFFQRPLTG